VTLGNTTLPLTLDNNARRRSGLGQSVAVSSGVRLRLKDGLAVIVDADGQFINQDGGADDDVSALLAAGPELTFKSGTRVSVQALAAARWFGGKAVSKGPGARTNFQMNLDDGQRIGLQVDVRHNASDYGHDFEGWQIGAYASYERVVDHSMVASLTLFGVRQSLGSAAYSNTEYGGLIGIGGELPHGINAGISGGISRAVFDEPMAFLSSSPRHDWKPNVRAYLGLRSIKVAGFSPSVTYTYNATLSSIPLYKTTRSRILFGVSRYF
jgi:outer membrane protein